MGLTAPKAQSVSEARSALLAAGRPAGAHTRTSLLRSRLKLMTAACRLINRLLADAILMRLRTIQVASARLTRHICTPGVLHSTPSPDM